MLIYSVDTAFLPMACISIGSMVEHCKGVVPPVVVLLHNVDGASKASAARYLTAAGVAFDLIDVDPAWCEPWARQRGQAPAKFGILRLRELIAAAPHRVIVVDADTRFVDDVGTLMALSLDGKPAAAVDDLAVLADGRVADLRAKLGLPDDAGYFNSGLLVIDLPLWHAQRIGEQAVDVFLHRPHILTFNDQCALNAVIGGRYRRLDFRWNTLVGTAPTAWAASMYHYAGHFKPWRLDPLTRWAIMRGLMERSHVDHYRDAAAALQWHSQPFATSRSDNIKRFGLFAKMLVTRRLDRYRQRPAAAELAARAHPPPDRAS